MTPTPRRWRALALLLPLSLAAAACGDGSEDEAAKASSGPETTTTTEASTTTTETTETTIAPETTTTLAVGAASTPTTKPVARTATTVAPKPQQQTAATTPPTLAPKPALEGSISADGSSTVGPLTEAAAELFQKDYPKVRVTVGISGTGGGFKKFCAGEIDIQDASRPINATERDQCAAKGIKYDAFQVANDALTVVVSRQNTWIDCITTAQLKKIWDTGSKVNNWKEVDASFPDEPLKLFGPGTASGTFDYFTEEINGKAKQSRTDYQATEDDNVIVTGVSGTKGGMGYFGFSYFEENESKLKALKIDSGAGCVTPGIDTVQAGTYKPLGRPLFIYASAGGLKKEHIRTFVEFYLLNTDPIAKRARFIPLTSAQKAKAIEQFKALQAQG